MNTKSPLYPIYTYVDGLEQDNADLKRQVSNLQTTVNGDQQKIQTLQQHVKTMQPNVIEPWAKQANRVISAGIWAQQLQIPYIYGGTYEKDKGFDCSSFVQSLYKLIGIDLPRLATPQSLTGTPIDYEKMDEGDLIFFDVFKTKAQIQKELATNPNMKVDHVGIYLGGGKMLHTNTPKQGIHVSAISDWYEPHFIRARRVIKH